MIAGAHVRLRGRAWVFPGTVTTDDILPGRFLDRSSDEVGAFAMAGIDPTFAARVMEGDVIVGGPNFGRGSGRESAPHALRRAGVAAVIAPSFARVFYRNCINIGLPPVVVDVIDDFSTGDVVGIDLEGRAVTNMRSDVAHLVRNLSGISLEILRAGGIVSYTLARGRRVRGEGS